jgi:hypothetical protein
MPIIPALRSEMQEDCEFKASLGYVWRTCPPLPPKKYPLPHLFSLIKIARLRGTYLWNYIGYFD